MTLENIVARYLQADSIGDPKDFLAQYNRVLQDLVLPEREVGDAKRLLSDVIEASGAEVQGVTRTGYKEAENLAYKAYFTVTRGWDKLHGSGHQLFLSLLQSYDLPPAIRKKVEIASRAYLKKPGKPRMKQKGIYRTLEYFAVYDKFITTMIGHAKVAQDAILKGRAHSEEGPSATKLRVGSFILVNTGGFSTKVMEEVTEVIEKVERSAKSAGFGKVCYGEVQVTNSIHANSRALAFYLIANDELFVRANVKNNVDTVRTVLHELGHRYEHKFLAGKKRDIQHLYHLIGRQEYSRASKAQETAPKPGETAIIKGKTYRVLGTKWSRGGVMVNLEVVVPGAPPGAGTKAHINLDGWNALISGGNRNVDGDPEYEGFVSEYAKRGGPSENFAEMFAFYCQGRLPPKQSEAFAEVI